MLDLWEAVTSANITNAFNADNDPSTKLYLRKIEGNNRYILYISLVLNISCLKLSGTTGRKVHPTFTTEDLVNGTYFDETSARDVLPIMRLAVHCKLLNFFNRVTVNCYL